MNLLEQESFHFLHEYKWPNGFVCPLCAHTEYYLIQTRRHPLYQCKFCRHQTSLQANTIMEGSRTPLYKWATAIHLISRANIGTSAVELRAAIRVTYKTAWLLLHRIRQAMSQSEQTKLLAGNVKSILKYYTQPYYSVYDKRLLKSPAIIAAQVDEKDNLLQLKLQHIQTPFIQSVNRISQWGVEAFAALHIRSDADFRGVPRPTEYKKTPLICDEYRTSKRWIDQTFHYIGPRYIQAYLNEYAFRRNCMIQNETIEEQLCIACTRYPCLPLDHYSPRALYNNYLQTTQNYITDKSA